MAGLSPAIQRRAIASKRLWMAASEAAMTNKLELAELFFSAS